MIVINWTGCGRKWHRPNLRYYPDTQTEKDGLKLECNKTRDPETAAFTTSSSCSCKSGALWGSETQAVLGEDSSVNRGVRPYRAQGSELHSGAHFPRIQNRMKRKHDGLCWYMKFMLFVILPKQIHKDNSVAYLISLLLQNAQRPCYKAKRTHNNVIIKREKLKPC